MPDELYDLDLTRGDIGQLENREALIAFFARLGYNVDDAAKTPLSALGLDSAEWQHQVRGAYRLAVDPEDEDIVVYLFEVRSVTKALIDAIGRSFGSREESPLLVLTHDYEQLDFVLVQRQKRVPGRDGVIRYGVETRGIKVERRNASTVHLRVLKRLTFTEADALLQWDKLVAAFTYAATASEFFNNRALFSDYYLTHRLTDGQLTSEWREEDQARYMARTARRLLVNARARLANKTRSAIWQELYAPLFKELRLWPERQAARDATAGAGQPDYLVFDPDDRSAALAAALVYPWERNLDNTDPVRDPERGDEIPGARVVSVLASASVSWAIVTNGKVWRLYAANADNRATNYYEIDLDEGLASIDQLTATKYWWLFFRREAFTGFLDRMLRESAEYAKGLRERLKNRVFEEVFARFAEGFILHGRARGAEPPLDETFAGTMTFLYRLMFILYAESLGLLPASEERGYGENSMARLKQEIASAGGDVEDEAPARLAVAYSPDSTALYERLAGLCAAIDQGDADLNLPRYNGGLFSATTPAGQFLARHAIPDRQLALGLDRLCRDQDDKTFDLVMVDYKTLGVRELGSIYEGLLEFKLRIAAEKLAVVREGGKEVYLPLARAKGKRAVQTLDPGDVYLENDKRERKASGSYYTPDYIVKYIVKHTVGPVLERKFEALRQRMYDAQRRYDNHKKKVIASGNRQPPELFWKNDDMARLADDCLDIKVLDPAMGSGHFLVEAVDFVSNQLIDFLNGWSDNPVWGLLARTQEDILADMVRQRVTIESARLTRVSLLKRAVLKRCIYGVDLNEMAVELAKLSLWLDAFTLGAPLSFLDHHLKHGNSLIGVRIKEVEDALKAAEAEQLGLLEQSQFAGVMLATDLMRQVGYLSDNTVGQLEESRRAYENATAHLAPYKRMLDVYTSRWFGNHPNLGKTKAFDPTIGFLKRDDAIEWLQDPTRAFPEKDYMDARGVAETALRVSKEKRFFHWELEFPEVFFAASTPGGQDIELREGAGFDAVVANPPYVTTSEETKDKEFRKSLQGVGMSWMAELNKARFSSLQTKWDLYLPFVEQFHNLAAAQGFVGTIIPSAFCVAPYADALREWLSRNTQIRKLIHFPGIFLFRGVGVLNIVMVTARSKPTSTHIADRLVAHDSEMELVHSLPDTPQMALSSRELFSPQESLMRIDSLLTSSLGQICYINKGGTLQAHDIYHRGLFVKDDLISVVQDAAHPKAYVEGKDLGRGELFQLRYLEYGPGTRNPSMVMEARFVEMFENPKLMFGKTSGVYLDAKGSLWCDQSARVAVPFQYLKKVDQRSVREQKRQASSSSASYDLGYLFAVCASKLISFHLKTTSTDVRDLTPEALKAIPVRVISFATEKRIRDAALQRLESFHARSDQPSITCLLSEIENFITLGQDASVHDFLAFLGRRLIALNTAKRSELSRFLTYLESRLHIKPDKDGATGIDSLAGKTVLQNYLGDYQKGERERTWDEFYHRLFQNRRRFGIPLDDVKGEIEAEYEKSLAVLLPIKEQLEATDNLIDKIVYRLYGLTEEEIAIIERPAFEHALAGAKAAVAGDKELQADPDKAMAEMADRVRAAGERVINQLSLAEERKVLDEALPGWNLYPDDVARALLTGEYSIRSMPDGLDFSGTVMEYSKAVEAAVYHRIFLRFRAESGCTAEDVENEKVFKPFMADPEKKLTIGSFHILLSSSKEKALQRFVRRIYPRADEVIYGRTGVLKLLSDQANIDLRNAAAHDKVLDRDAAKAVRAWAFAVLRNL